MTTLAIVGAGRAGLAVGHLLAQTGLPVLGAVCRRSEHTARACGILGCLPAPVTSFVPQADLVVVAVPDHALAPVTVGLAAQACFRPGQVVMHLSGALTAEVLAPARERGAAVMSWHPLQTFPDLPPAHATLARCLVVGEGDAPALAVGAELAARLDARWEVIGAAGKVLYHAGATIASNYLVALVAVAGRLLAQAGLPADAAGAGLHELMQSALRHACTQGPLQALTGPVARGDLGTVAGHLAALDGHERRVYAGLGLVVLELAAARGLDARRVSSLQALFEEALS